MGSSGRRDIFCGWEIKRYIFESFSGREGLTGGDWGYAIEETEEGAQNEKFRKGYDK